MFEKFTDRARKVMTLANQEAQRLNHEYVGTEHVLLGLVKEGSGIASFVLKALDCDLLKLREEVGKIVKAGPETVIMGRLPQTPKTKRVIECAILESRRLGHNYVGTEHLLLGLLCDAESNTDSSYENVAQQILHNCGVTLERVQEEVMALLDFSGESDIRDIKDVRLLVEKVIESLSAATKASDELRRILG